MNRHNGHTVPAPGHAPTSNRTTTSPQQQQQHRRPLPPPGGPPPGHHGTAMSSAQSTSINFLGNGPPMSGLAGGAPMSLDPFELGTHGQHHEELDNFRLLDAAETLVNLQSMQEQQQQEQQQQQLLEGGSVIYLSNPSPSNSTSLQISPLSSPILHQLSAAPPPPPPSQQYLEEKTVVGPFVGGHEPQLELRGAPMPMDAAELRFQRAPRGSENDAFDLSISPNSSSGERSAMGPPPVPPPLYDTGGPGALQLQQRLSGAADPHPFPSGAISPSAEIMKPPPPPPSRRGRGRGRGGGGERGGRGRGRGRGRGKASSTVTSGMLQQQAQQGLGGGGPGGGGGGAELGDVGDAAAAAAADEVQSPAAAAAAKPVETFQLGHLEVKNSLFDDLLNRRKLELLNDPDVLALLAASKKKAGRPPSSARK